MMHVRKNWALLIIAGLLSAGCVSKTYQAKPLDSQNTTTKILARDPTSKEFNQYLITQGYSASQLPLTSWGLEEMTWCAMFYHDKLKVAKAQLALANASIAVAGIKANPNINGSIAHSNQANGDIRPWSYGLNVDIPIETANKRKIKIEEAQQSAIAAKLEVAESAWQLRSQINNDLQAYYQQLANISLLQSSVDTQLQITQMLQKRFETGLIDSNQMRDAELIQLKSQNALRTAEADSAQLLEKLAADTGLSMAQFKKIAIRPFDSNMMFAEKNKLLSRTTTSTSTTLAILQETALLNRLDIRRSLAKYAAAEAKLRLEIAKQHPDISLNPGILFDFGDKIWSLGFSSLLNLTQNNDALISEATELRAVEGAQFEQVQADTIAQISQAYTNFLVSKDLLIQTERQYQINTLQFTQMERQFNSGLIDRLTLTQAKQIVDLLQQQVLSAKFDVLTAINRIENVLQAPISQTVFLNNEVSSRANDEK